MRRSRFKLALLSLTISMVGCQSAPPVDGDAASSTSIETVDSEEMRQIHEQQLAAAHAAQQAGDYDVALTLFRDILADNPTVTTAYLGIGDIYLLNKDYAAAEPAYRRAARIEPRNFDAQFGHGVALQMLRRFAEAVKAYYRSLTIDPDSVNANLAIATTYLEMEQPHSALLFAEKVVELEPSNGAARVNLGAVYEQTGRSLDAIEQYEAATRLMEPTEPLLLNYIGVLARANRYLDARDTAEWLVRIEPSANGFERLGWANFRLGEYDKSVEAYRRAVEIDASHWVALNGVGCNALNTWLLSKKRDQHAALEAKHSFQRSLQINPEQQKVINLLTQYDL